VSETASGLHVAYGRPQKEFVDVPDALFLDLERVRPWFAASVGWIQTLKPKATTRGR
jgi:hypothetical protein